MYTVAWGQTLHDALTFVVLAYPEKNPTIDQQENIRKFFKYTFANLPCPMCIAHATRYFKGNPPPVGSQKELHEWLVTFHNSINRRTGKKADWTVEESRKAIFDRHFTDLKKLDRANNMRIEDSRMMNKLSAKVAVYKRLLKDHGIEVSKDEELIEGLSDTLSETTFGSGASSGVDEKISRTEKMTIATLTIVSTLLVLLICYALYKQFKKYVFY